MKQLSENPLRVETPGQPRSSLPQIYSDELEIRLARQTDFSEIASYVSRNREFHGPWEPLRPEGYYTETFWKIQIDRNIDDYQRGRAVRFYVFDLKDDSVIAYISFTNFVRGAGNYCTLGYNLDLNHQGKGVMVRSVDKSISHIHQTMGLHRIMANYMPRNRKSAKLLQRLGFIIEGYSREYLMINGVWEDHVLTGKIIR